jgi:hypothetical protein
MTDGNRERRIALAAGANKGIGQGDRALSRAPMGERLLNSFQGLGRHWQEASLSR